MSSLLAVSGNTLCVALDISVPKNFSVQAKLFSLDSPRTVYEAATTNSRDVAMDLLSTFEVPLTAQDGGQVQLVVYVSINVTINAVTTSFGNCPNSSLYPLVLLTDNH